jgi:hypothetical protein
MVVCDRELEFGEFDVVVICVEIVIEDLVFLSGGVDEFDEGVR